MIRYLTSGESHGKCLTAIVDGIPAGLKVDINVINNELKRRMFGYGRGKRMKIESDKVQILSGLRNKVTIGSPVTLMVTNVDQSIDSLPAVTDPRPAHADLPGAIKFNLKDIRSVLERASARETAIRVAAGALARILLRELGIDITSHVTVIGGIEANVNGLRFDQIVRISEKSQLRCADPEASDRMCTLIDASFKQGDTLGGVFEVIIRGLPAGLGSYTQWDKKLDGRIAGAMMSIQAVKGVSFGAGFETANKAGSLIHDEIFYEKKRGFFRRTNNAGGIEGGMSNGEDIVIRAAMKPIATLSQALASVNIKTKKATRANVQRSDVCAVPAAGVIGENVAAIEIANAMLEKFGGDSMDELKRNYKGYLAQIKAF